MPKKKKDFSDKRESLKSIVGGHGIDLHDGDKSALRKEIAMHKTILLSALSDLEIDECTDDDNLYKQMLMEDPDLLIFLKKEDIESFPEKSKKCSQEKKMKCGKSECGHEQPKKVWN